MESGTSERTFVLRDLLLQSVDSLFSRRFYAEWLFIISGKAVCNDLAPDFDDLGHHDSSGGGDDS